MARRKSRRLSQQSPGPYELPALALWAGNGLETQAQRRVTQAKDCLTRLCNERRNTMAKLKTMDVPEQCTDSRLLLLYKRLDSLVDEITSARLALESAINAPVPCDVDPTEWLPDELIIEILLSLPCETLWRKHCPRVCRRWYRLFGVPSVQRRLRSTRWEAYGLNVARPTVLQGHEGAIRALAVGPSGVFYTGSADYTIREWSTCGSSSTCKDPLRGHTDALFALAVSSDRIYSGADDTHVKVWRASSGELIQTLTGHNAGISSLIVGRDGHVYSGSFDGTVKVWSEKDGTLVRTLEGHTQGISAIALGKRNVLMSGSVDSTVRIWSCETGEELHTLYGHTNVVFSVAVGCDGTLFTGSADCTVRVWRHDDWAPLQVLDTHKDFIYALAVSKDGTLFTGSADQAIHAWRRGKDGRFKLNVVLTGHNSEVLGLAVDDAGTLVSTSADGLIRLW